jgi:hypothetical protein
MSIGKIIVDVEVLTAAENATSTALQKLLKEDALAPSISDAREFLGYLRDQGFDIVRK